MLLFFLRVILYRMHVRWLFSLFCIRLGGISLSTRPSIRSMRHLANILRCTERIIIVCKFCGDPFGLPGFCSAYKIPCVIFLGCSLVFAILL